MDLVCTRMKKKVDGFGFNESEGVAIRYLSGHTSCKCNKRGIPWGIASFLDLSLRRDLNTTQSAAAVVSLLQTK